MRKTVLLLAVMALAVVAASGAALADNFQGNGGNNRLVGTNGKDTIAGSGGHDDIFGKGGQDRLFGDAGNDEVRGGDQGDRIQGGLGQDDLFGQSGNDFLNVIDGQTNDSVDCGEGEFDVAGVDFFLITDPNSEPDEIAPNCEAVYIGIGPIPIGPGPAGAAERSGAAADLSAIDTREEAERAEAKGLLRQIR